MGYKVPDWKKSIEQNKFEVEVGEHTFSIPRADFLSAEHVELLQNSGELGLIWVLNQICPPKTRKPKDGEGDEPIIVKPGLGDAFAPVPIRYANEFVAAWQKDAKVDLGESEASSDS